MEVKQKVEPEAEYITFDGERYFVSTIVGISHEGDHLTLDITNKNGEKVPMNVMFDIPQVWERDESRIVKVCDNRDVGAFEFQQLLGEPILVRDVSDDDECCSTEKPYPCTYHFHCDLPTEKGGNGESATVPASVAIGFFSFIAAGIVHFAMSVSLPWALTFLFAGLFLGLAIERL